MLRVIASYGIVKSETNTPYSGGQSVTDVTLFSAYTEVHQYTRSILSTVNLCETLDKIELWEGAQPTNRRRVSLIYLL